LRPKGLFNEPQQNGFFCNPDIAED